MQPSTRVPVTEFWEKLREGGRASGDGLPIRVEDKFNLLPAWWRGMPAEDRKSVQSRWLGSGKSWSVENSLAMCKIAKIPPEDLTKLRLCLVVLDEPPEGIDWVLPFEAARERAKEENRLLMIKPVAFGTTPDGGW